MAATRHGDFLLNKQEALLRRSCLFAVHKKADPGKVNAFLRHDL